MKRINQNRRIHETISGNDVCGGFADDLTRASSSLGFLVTQSRANWSNLRSTVYIRMKLS